MSKITFVVSSRRRPVSSVFVSLRGVRTRATWQSLYLCNSYVGDESRIKAIWIPACAGMTLKEATNKKGGTLLSHRSARNSLPQLS